MEYRENKRLNARVSLLGFGGMRFPTDGEGKIREAEAAGMLRRALEGGVNYFDTAHYYHDSQSEAFLGRVLAGVPRDSYYLATKLPVWKVESVSDAQAIFDLQLERLHTGYFDFYLFHALDRKRWQAVKKQGMVEWAEELVRAGKIRRLGFSFHDSYEAFEEILTARQWDFCQLQLNYVDWLFQDGKAKVELLEERRIPVWVMEPLRGGRLARLSDQEAAPLKAMRPDETIPAWAFRFLQSIPSVTMVLSGMSDLEQMKANIATFQTEAPLNEKEAAGLMEVAGGMVSQTALPCTACHYCVSHCPKGLNIPELLALYNEHSFTGGGFLAPMALSAIPQDKWPSACIGCRSCEKVCPQQLKISEAMADFTAKLNG